MAKFSIWQDPDSPPKKPQQPRRIPLRELNREETTERMRIGRPSGPRTPPGSPQRTRLEHSDRGEFSRQRLVDDCENIPMDYSPSKKEMWPELGPEEDSFPDGVPSSPLDAHSSKRQQMSGSPKSRSPGFPSRLSQSSLNSSQEWSPQRSPNRNSIHKSPSWSPSSSLRSRSQSPLART